MYIQTVFLSIVPSLESVRSRWPWKNLRMRVSFTIFYNSAYCIYFYLYFFLFQLRAGKRNQVCSTNKAYVLHDSVFKREKSDFYDVLPIHTILLDIFLPSSTKCRTRPTVANKFTSITRDVIQNGAYLVRHLGFYLIFRCKQKNNSNMNTIKIR